MGRRGRPRKSTLADHVLVPNDLAELGISPGHPLDFDEDDIEARLDEYDIVYEIRRRAHIGEYGDG